MTEHIATVRGRRGKGPRSRKAKQAKRQASLSLAAQRRDRTR